MYVGGSGSAITPVMDKDKTGGMVCVTLCRYPLATIYHMHSAFPLNVYCSGNRNEPNIILMALDPPIQSLHAEARSFRGNKQTHWQLDHLGASENPRRLFHNLCTRHTLFKRDP